MPKASSAVNFERSQVGKGSKVFRQRPNAITTLAKRAPLPKAPMPKLTHPAKRVKASNSLDALRCGLRPFKGVVHAELNGNAIADYTDAIVGLLNDEHGVVPTAGSFHTPAAVWFYIQLCLLAYLDRVGIVSGDTSFVSAYAKFYVPAWLAILFQHCATYKSKKQGCSFSLNTTNFSYTTLTSSTRSDGNTQNRVANGVYAGYGNEPTFGLGALRTFTDYDMDDWDSLSKLIQSNMKSVCVADIATYAPSHQGIVKKETTADLFEVYSFLKPTPGCVGSCPLFYVQEVIGPHQSFCVPARTGGTSTPSPAMQSTRFLFAHFGKDTPYASDISISKIFGSAIGDPNRMSITYHSVSATYVWGLMWDWLFKIGYMNSQTAITAAVCSVLGTLFAYWWASLTARSFFGSRLPGNYANYKAENMKNASIPPCLGEIGVGVTHSRGNVYYPILGNASFDSLLTNWRAGLTFTANTSTQPGNYPCDITGGGLPAGVTFAGISIAPSTTAFNISFLRMMEESEAYLWTHSSIRENCVPYPEHHPACPCDVGYTLGQNSQENAPIKFYYPAVYSMSCSRPVGPLECKQSLCAGPYVQPELTVFTSAIVSFSQNPYRDATASGYLGNNFVNFSGPQSSDPHKRLKKMYVSNMMGDVLTTVVDFTGKQILEMAHAYLDEGGEPYPLPGSDFIQTLGEGIKDIGPLVAQTAGALTTLTAAGMGFVKAINSIRARVPAHAGEL